MKKLLLFILLFIVFAACGGQVEPEVDATSTPEPTPVASPEPQRSTLDEREIESFITEFSVLIYQQGNRPMLLLTDWVSYATERLLQDGVMLHHIPPAFYDEIYVNEFIINVVTEMSSVFCYDDDIEANFLSLLSSFSYINEMFKLLTELDLNESIELLTGPITRQANAVDNVFSELAALRPAIDILNFRVASLDEYDDFRTDLLAKHGFDFDFNHGFDIPEPEELSSTMTLSIEEEVILRDIANLLVISFYSVASSLIADFDFTRGQFNQARFDRNLDRMVAELLLSAKVREWLTSYLETNVQIFERYPHLQSQFHYRFQSISRTTVNALESVSNPLLDAHNSRFRVNNLEAPVLADFYAGIDRVNEAVTELNNLIPRLQILTIDDYFSEIYEQVFNEIISRNPNLTNSF